METKVLSHVEEVLGALVSFGESQIAELTTINLKGKPETFKLIVSFI